MSYSKKEPQAGLEPEPSTAATPAPAQEKLPAGWTQKRDPSSGRPYYVNSATKVTTWDRPIPEGVPQPNAVEMPPEPEPESAEEVQEEKSAEAADPPLPTGWEEKTDPRSGKNYYINYTTKVTQWERPTELIVSAIQWEEEVAGAWVPLDQELCWKLEGEFSQGTTAVIPVGAGDDVSLVRMQMSRRDEGDLQYYHVDPKGRKEFFSAADNAAITQARKRGDSKVKINPVQLPNGHVLNFEVRFGAAAKSAKVPKAHACGMVQVNLASENTRQVAVTSASGAKPAINNIRRDPNAAPKFFHIDPDTHIYIPYSDEDNAAIAQGKASGTDAVRISDRLANGAMCQFEVRFNNAAVSTKSIEPSPTGIAQVNLTLRWRCPPLKRRAGSCRRVPLPFAVKTRRRWAGGGSRGGRD